MTTADRGTARTTITTRLRDWRLARFLSALAGEFRNDDVPGMAAEMAYRFLFALFPLLLFLVAVLGYLVTTLGLSDSVTRLLNGAGAFLPAPTVSIVQRYVAELLTAKSAGFLSIGLLGTLWGAAGGVATLMKGLNRAYNVEQPRPFWQRKLLAVGITVLLPPVGLALLAVAILGERLAGRVGAGLGLQQPVAVALAWIRWPVLLVLLVLGFSLIYHLLPNTRHPYVWALPGSLVATVGWLALAFGFARYVAHFGNFDATYGSVGAVVAFILWLYLVGIVILLGAEINGLLAPSGRARWSGGTAHRDAERR